MIAFDFETFLIRPGLLAPPPVCLTWATLAPGADIIHAKELTEEGMHDLLFAHRPTIVGANLAFDLGVMAQAFPGLVPDIFRAYEDGRCRDVQIDQKLIDIAHGRLGGIYRHGKQVVEYRYSLADLEKRHFGADRSSEKTAPDAWRLRYHELYNVPMAEWPQDAIDYALADSTGARRVHLKQEEEFGHLLTDGMAQAAAAWSLHLMSAWGLKTHEQNIRTFQKICEAKYRDLTDILQREGLVRLDGTRDTKKAARRMIEVCEAAGIPVPRTEGHKKKLAALAEIANGGPVPPGDNYVDYEDGVCLDADACSESEDEILEAYSERTSLHTIVTTHIPALHRGVNSVIQPSFNILVESGRTSCKGADSGKKRPKHWCGKALKRDCIPRSEEDRFCVICGEQLPITFGYQTQNVSRLEGLRECFTARDGTYLIDTDFSGLELCTGAQVCIILVGYSHLGEALNAGLDPHLAVAAALLHIPYEEARHHFIQGDKEVTDARQIGKVADFGFPGGLGAKGFRAYARGYGLKLTVAESEAARDAFFRTWPEWKDYFRHIDSLCRQDPVEGLAEIIQLFSGRVRGGVRYTAACNTFFQGLGADVAKRAAFAVARACYDVTMESVLYGSRPVNFIHDQIITETPIATAHEAAFEQARVMVEAANAYLPAVPVKCEPALSTVWTKGAKAVFLDGRLVPWDLAKAGKWNVTDADGERMVWK